MSLRARRRPLPDTRESLAAAIPNASGKLVVLVHGLCMNDLQWQREGHDHGAALARDLGYTSVYLHYNSGLHISINGACVRRTARSAGARVAGAVDATSCSSATAWAGSSPAARAITRHSRDTNGCAG